MSEQTTVIIAECVDPCAEAKAFLSNPTDDIEAGDRAHDHVEGCSDCQLGCDQVDELLHRWRRGARAQPLDIRLVDIHILDCDRCDERHGDVVEDEVTKLDNGHTSYTVDPETGRPVLFN